jgi:tetratricopeptide (TPR) repeat protein
MNWEKYQETVLLEEAGKYAEAISQLQKLIDTSPDPVDNYLVFIGIANCLRQMGQPEEAREFVRKSYDVLGEKNHYYPSVMFIDACIDQEVGNWQGALAKLDSILERFPSVLQDAEYEDLKMKVLGNRGFALVELKRYGEARPLLEFALGKNYYTHRVLLNLGACCYHLGDLESANRYLTKALQFNLNPGYALLAHYYLAVTLLWQGQHARAKQEFEWCFEHNDGTGVRKDYVLTGLVNTSKALGLKEDADRYSEMLAADRQISNLPDGRSTGQAP